jgi:hypothetical protein
LDLIGASLGKGGDAHIPGGVTALGFGAFIYCLALADISVPAGVWIKTG